METNHTPPAMSWILFIVLGVFCFLLPVVLVVDVMPSTGEAIAMAICFAGSIACFISAWQLRQR